MKGAGYERLNLSSLSSRHEKNAHAIHTDQGHVESHPGQNVLKYLTVILNELPGVQTSEEIEALLPWRLSKSEVSTRYARLPWPAVAISDTPAAPRKKSE